MGYLKQRLVSALRAARLLPVAETLRFARAVMVSRSDNSAFLGANPGFRPPPLWWMHDMYAHTSYRAYVQSGAADAHQIIDAIEANVDAEEPRVAEWGCGLGRLIRNMPARFCMHGFDCNAAAIEWCRANIPSAEFSTNKLMPPLPAKDGAFDALYCISVFTHLSLAAHERWIGELARVLEPGGVLVASFHGPAQAQGLLPAEQDAFDSGALVVRDKVVEGSRIFVAYHPHAFVRSLLTSFFEIIDGPLDAVGQTLWIARKTK